MASPSAAPSEASTKLSVSICRTNRPRLPPKARRTAISLRREAARANSKFATLAQAIRSTTATAAIRIASAGRMSCFKVTGDCSDIRLRLGHCRAGLETAHDHQPTTTTIGEGEMRARHVVLHHHWSPHIECEARKGAGKILGSDADDREVMLV